MQNYYNRHCSIGAGDLINTHLLLSRKCRDPEVAILKCLNGLFRKQQCHLLSLAGKGLAPGGRKSNNIPIMIWVSFQYHIAMRLGVG